MDNVTRADTKEEHINRMKEAIKTENLSVFYDNIPAICDINITIEEGASLALFGAGKSGKTTFLKAAAGLIKPDKGNVYVFSRAALTITNHSAWVPENSEVNWGFPASVYEAAAMGLINRPEDDKKNKKMRKEAVSEALNEMELYNIRKKSIGDISFGERERLLIARAIVQNPRIYIIDEPFSSSDREGMDTIFNAMLNMKKRGKTVIAAHKDIITTPEYYDTVLFLNKNVLAYGKKEDIMNSENIEKAYGKKSGYVKS